MFSSCVPNIYYKKLYYHVIEKKSSPTAWYFHRKRKWWIGRRPSVPDERPDRDRFARSASHILGKV